MLFTITAICGIINRVIGNRYLSTVIAKKIIFCEPLKILPVKTKYKNEGQSRSVLKHFRFKAQKAEGVFDDARYHGAEISDGYPYDG